MQILYEYRPDVRRNGKPKLMASTDMIGLQGFTSLYGFDEETAKLIQQRRGTWGLEGLALYSDTLYVDIDDNPDLIAEVRAKLTEMHIGFSQYESGSPNSGHFHIPLKPMYSENVPYVQKQWVKEHLGTEVDLSIYKTSGIIRIPGSYHKRYPGRKKQLIYGVGFGSELDLSEYESTVEIKMPKARTQNTEAEYREAVDIMLMEVVEAGQRHNKAFRLAAAIRDAGYDRDKAMELLTVWNEQMVHPALKQRAINTTVKSAYRGV